MAKLNLVFLSMLMSLTINSQTLFSNKDALEWVTYYCGGTSDVATGNDTLIVNPNPFDSVAVIEFIISNNDTISLDIFNALGQTIKTYYNATILSSGSYTLSFNGDTLPNGIYFVRLKINSIIQSVKLIKDVNVVGINETSLNKPNLIIYPNPTTSIINIEDENNQLQNTTIQIKNHLGQLILTSPFTSQINLHSLSAGMYFLTVQDKYKRSEIKIIKN